MRSDSHRSHRHLEASILLIVNHKTTENRIPCVFSVFIRTQPWVGIEALKECLLIEYPRVLAPRISPGTQRQYKGHDVEPSSGLQICAVPQLVSVGVDKHFTMTGDIVGSQRCC